jgi:glycerol-3-phosphate dehydrogenase (NAD(P)+)
MKMVAEGVTTVKSVYNLSRKYNIDMPITKEIYYMLYKDKAPAQAVKDLMSRPLKAE